MFASSDFTNLEKIYESHKSLVYRGLRTQNRQPIILKLLKEDYPTPDEVARYQQEYEILHHLQIEGAIQAYDAVKYRNSIALVLEDFGGDSLDLILSRRGFSLTEFLEIGIQITDILAKLHQAGIIHKDINPSNIVLNERSRQIKLIDFGISQTLSSKPELHLDPDIVQGTLAYISPEQTGRTSHKIDRRTDFYSLGVTFYQLLTGRLPFETEEPIEMLHCHVARQPVPISQINPEIPEMVSAIAMKLLAKNPESRYQNAYGVIADLQKCAIQLQEKGKIESFPLGDRDLPDKLTIPDRLYARDRELRQLIETFEKVSRGSSELTAIHGYSGVGKSVLVTKIREIAIARNGRFISGKFDSLQRTIPYYALINACHQLVQQLLTESSAILEEWRDKILQALGINGQLLTRLIPELELIVGKQPPVIEVSAEDSINRFKLIFQKFIKLFCQPDSPLIVFLDDLHWADSATSILIKSIMEDPGTNYLWFIVAYRDDRVEESHPAIASLTNLDRGGKQINYLHVQPLKLTDVNQLLADTFKTELERTKPLAELVYKKTRGNPFFTSEFLKTLYAEKLIYLHSRRCSSSDRFIELEWQWDLANIDSKSIADNVVELMALKIQKLPDKTQNLLKLAACIGNKFDVRILTVITGNNSFEVLEDLRPALENELIIISAEDSNSALIGSYKNFTNNLQINSSRYYLTVGQSTLKFVHDRIQQAAYFLIPEAERKSTHLQIGRLLLKQVKSSKLEEKLFNPLDSLNTGIQIIDNLSEREELARLNLDAAREAKQTAAYESALFYLKIGIDLLAPDCWHNRYELALDLYVEAVEAAYLSGALEQMRALSAVVIKESRTVLDAIEVNEIIIKADTAQNQPLAALKTALSVLELLNIYFPESPTQSDVYLEFQRTQAALGTRKIAELIDLPVMTAPDKLAATKIISNSIAAAYFTSPEMMSLFTLKLFNLSLEYGNTSWSCFVYANYGLFVTSLSSDLDLGYEYAKLALDLVEKLGAIDVKAKTVHIVLSSIKPFKERVQDTLEPLLENYQIALETGDIKYGAYSLSVYAFHANFTSYPLEKLERELAAYSQLVYQLKEEVMFDFIEFGRQI